MLASFLAVFGCACAALVESPGTQVPRSASAALQTAASAAQEPLDLRLAWKDNLLTISAPGLPGETIEVWYLEAFCRSGSTDRKWEETVIPHQTELVSQSADGKELRLHSVVEPAVTVEHVLRAEADGVAFDLTLRNSGERYVDVVWGQPCIRVEKFTGLGQEDYIRNCFIHTDNGFQSLGQLPRNEEARYHGGQIYVPSGINTNDVNPRPRSPVTPALPLIGCVSADGQWLLAAAWSDTQELFQGVITCIHSDFRIGGLAPGETKHLRGKISCFNDTRRILLHEPVTASPCATCPAPRAGRVSTALSRTH
ncbi:MAG: hypothetical protein HYV26_05175 [Candidatus Hydrogenedentes bacterium]|nr:hypothetical protein [Candidatus Hydrogenedentota bacterium]